MLCSRCVTPSVLGRYYFELAEAIKAGGFRPLRNPNDPNEPFY